MDFKKIRGELETAVKAGRLAFTFALSDIKRKSAYNCATLRSFFSEHLAVKNEKAALNITVLCFMLSFLLFFTVLFTKESGAPLNQNEVSEDVTPSQNEQRFFKKRAMLHDPFAVGLTGLKTKKAPSELKLIGIIGAGEQRRVIVSTKSGEIILSEGERASGILLIEVKSEEKTATVETNGQIYELEMTR